MSEQLFSFEGRFITLAQIERIKEERALATEKAVKKPVARRVAAPKVAEEVKVEDSKPVEEAEKIVSEATEEELKEAETSAEEVKPETVTEEEVIVVKPKRAAAKKPAKSKSKTK